ncbi:MAG TPA: hypothetical protein VHZ99_03990 [Steroidobacteraceae bacterium]|nr:hypothetical protein [Steroidobacteraceae bacterium]
MAMHDEVAERQALAWMADPFAAFDGSHTRIHSVPRDEQEAVQLAGLRARFEERREQIPVLAKLAETQGIREIRGLDDAAALLFAHNVYKSYPVSLLSKQRFDQLTRWLDRLTPFDLSSLDSSGCRSIDEWLSLLQSQTPLDVATSSGTGGTLSFFPKSKRDYRVSVTGLRVQLTQPFGAAPRTADLSDKIHAFTPFYRDGYSTVARLPHYIREIFCGGDATFLETALPYKLSADLMWLGARVRAAQAKGDSTRIDVPESLLARRGEWDALQRDVGTRQVEFIQDIVQRLRGERVFALGITQLFYEIARRGIEAGNRGAFAAGSVIMGGGGGKGMVLPDDADDTIRRFFGIDNLRTGYGMTEQNGFFVTCDNDRHHLLPWVTLFVLDQETGRPLPRRGVQIGRAAFFDMTHDGAWGGVVTGDRVTADFGPCRCGRSTVHLDRVIRRFSELQGDDDKITCAAAPAAQAAALDYLTSL